MIGILRAKSIETYALFSFDGKMVSPEFTVKDVKARKVLDKLQGKRVDFDKDVLPLLKTKK